jgi:hypothetical protein
MKPIHYLTLHLVILLFSCKKLVSIPEPINSITTNEVFGSPAQANSAMAGIYANLIQSSGYTWANGGLTIFGGLSSDELLNFGGSEIPDQYQFYSNSILSNNSDLASQFWPGPYFTIYQTNAIISGLANSATIDDSTKNELTGEALFIRSFCYFYLVNMFGDVPKVTTVNYNNTDRLPRTSTDSIYVQIISDLKQAQSLMRPDYSYTLASGQRVIPNKWAAAALLARVYLYISDYSDAYMESNSLISQRSTYSLSNIAHIFDANSNEAIWQLQQNPNNGSANGTVEGAFYFIVDPGNPPNYYLSDSLIAAFEPNDLRYSNWIDSTNYNGTYYYFPYKYNVGPDQVSYGTPAPQYYMVLRLGEQYLIRAECELNGQGGGLSSAIQDLDTIRGRAGLPALGSVNNSQTLTALIQERRIELFAEWGHRWFDLKRLGIAASTLSSIKGLAVTNDALLFPIPVSEIVVDNNLTQNPGYQ